MSLGWPPGTFDVAEQRARLESHCWYQRIAKLLPAVLTAPGKRWGRPYRTQSFAVTASRISANFSRAAVRRVGTCSLGTPSGGGS
jgi:hypothetical protein